MSITDSSKERESVALEIAISAQGKIRSFWNAKGSRLGLGQPEAIRARGTLQGSKRGHMYAFRKQHNHAGDAP